MPVPDFQSVMLPLLQLAGDGQVHSVSEAIERLAAHFQLTDEDRRELVPSGAQRRFDNRVNWSRSYLKKAGLLESPGRGKFQVTSRGLKVLEDNPDRIDVAYLMQFSEFVKFRTDWQKRDDVSPVTQISAESSDQTPEEALDAAYQRLKQDLAQEIIDRIKQSPPSFFEQTVVDLLVAMGYGGSRRDAGQAVGRTGDGGIDGIIKEDRLGLDTVFLQAKRWDSVVGRPVVQGFAGSLAGVHANKGIFITTSRFSDDARGYVQNLGMKIVLIDGEQLADLMIEYGVGVTEVNRYSVKRIDLDYFDAE